jgi:hypothetical protein
MATDLILSHASGRPRPYPKGGSTLENAEAVANNAPLAPAALRSPVTRGDSMR